MSVFNKDDDKVNKLQGYVILYRECGQHFIITINGALPLKATNHDAVYLKLM